MDEQSLVAALVHEMLHAMVRHADLRADLILHADFAFGQRCNRYMVGTNRAWWLRWFTRCCMQWCAACMLHYTWLALQPLYGRQVAHPGGSAAGERAEQLCLSACFVAMLAGSCVAGRHAEEFAASYTAGFCERLLRPTHRQQLRPTPVCKCKSSGNFVLHCTVLFYPYLSVLAFATYLSRCFGRSSAATFALIIIDRGHAYCLQYLFECISFLVTFK